MESVKIRELDEKSNIKPTDLVIIEDNDGTKVARVSNITSVIRQQIYFETVEDMKNATLQDGDVVTTLGFYEINDGGGATYIIKYAPAELQDNMFIHYLNTSDTLRAFLIHEKKVNALQLGARGDGVTNDSRIISAILSNGYELYLPYMPDGYKLNLYLKDNFNNRVLDFNNNTIIGYIDISGSNEGSGRVKNITIKNATIKYGTSYLFYTRFADDITLDNIILSSIDDSYSYNMTGASIMDSSNIIFSNCTIGSEAKPLKFGIDSNYTQFSLYNTKIFTSYTGIDITTRKATNYNIDNSTIVGTVDNTIGINTSDKEKIIINKTVFKNLGTAININLTYSESEIEINNSECTNNTSSLSYVLFNAKSKDSIFRINKVNLTKVNPFKSRRGRIYFNGRFDKITDNSDYTVDATAIRSDCVIVDSNDPTISEYGTYPISREITTSQYVGPMISLNTLENCRVIIVGYTGQNTGLNYIDGGIDGQIIYLYKMQSLTVRIYNGATIKTCTVNENGAFADTWLSTDKYIKLQKQNGIWQQII